MTVEPAPPVARAFLLAAGRGLRFRPVTERIPKPLLEYLNVPLARAHLRRLRDAGILEAAVNLHHLGEQIEENLVHGAAELPQLRFFAEPEILGTAGALRNAGSWLSGGEFLVVNSDAAIDPDYARLLRRHRESGRAATLLVVENLEPDRYTPLQSEGDRVTAFGSATGRPLDRAPWLYTGVCVLAPRLLDRIPPGEASLVSDLWEPLLAEGREEIGWLLHEGSFADLGRPRDFLRASLEALARGGPFPAGAGRFDEKARVLSAREISGFDVRDSVIAGAAVGDGARIASSALWGGVEVGARADLRGCIAARGRIEPDARFDDSLLWSPDGGTVRAYPLG
ncbi:MAG: sugar phosphate nucleotidyltransferase [Acidobacteriota bacterium]